MADKIKINRLTNANVYVDGNSFLGKAEEINLPVIKQKMSEHKALGMIGLMEFFAGFEKMEAKIKWNSFYSDVLKKMGDPTTAMQIQVRASLEVYTAAGRTEQLPLVVFMTATAKDFPLGNYKQHDNVEAETNLNVTYVRLEINNEPIVELDLVANIYKVNGVDKFATYRNNLGI